MDLEQIWYEVFPYLYGIGGFVAIFLPGGSGLLRTSGVLLIAASITILRLRWVYRRAWYKQLPSPSELIETPGQAQED
jgi:hypothetical protein